MYACLDIHHAYFIYSFMTCLISPTLALRFPTRHSAPRAATGHVLPGFHNCAAEHGRSRDTPEIEDSTKSMGRAMLLSEVVPTSTGLLEIETCACLSAIYYGYKMHKKFMELFDSFDPQIGLQYYSRLLDVAPVGNAFSDFFCNSTLNARFVDVHVARHHVTCEIFVPVSPCHCCPMALASTDHSSSSSNSGGTGGASPKSPQHKEKSSKASPPLIISTSLYPFS